MVSPFIPGTFSVEVLQDCFRGSLQEDFSVPVELPTKTCAALTQGSPSDCSLVQLHVAGADVVANLADDTLQQHWAEYEPRHASGMLWALAEMQVTNCESLCFGLLDVVTAGQSTS